jgi:hypothetical protein
MTNRYECGSCGVISEESNQLCQPKEVAGVEEYCGVLAPRDICDTMNETASFECAACGRLADEKELVCDPHKIR